MNYNSYNSKGKALANDGSEIDASTAKKEGAERHLPIQRPKNMAKAAASDEKGEPPKKKKRRKATTEATAMSVNLDGDDGQVSLAPSEARATRNWWRGGRGTALNTPLKHSARDCS